MTWVVAVDVHDVRFPTSAALDGSDAMNPDGDYSAAYVVISNRRHPAVRSRADPYERSRYRPVRGGGAADRDGADRPGRFIEYGDHLHEQFVNPVVVTGGRCRVPNAPGYSIELCQESVRDYSYPDGKQWRQSAAAPQVTPWLPNCVQQSCETARRLTSRCARSWLR